MTEWCPYSRRTTKQSPSYAKYLGMFCSSFFREVKNLIIADNGDESKNAIYSCAKNIKSYFGN